MRGLGNDTRRVEGFYVPLLGRKVDSESEMVDSRPLVEFFHSKDGTCIADAMEHPLEGQLDVLERRIEEIPVYVTPGDEDRYASREPWLRLDKSREQETTEAWVPVVCPAGPGVLVWKNCD